MINNVRYSQGQLPAFNCFAFALFNAIFTLRHCGNAFLRRVSKPMHGHAEHRNTAETSSNHKLN